MKRELKEAEKNFLICAGLIIVAGIGMVIMGKTFMGWFSIVCGGVFAIVAINSILTTEGPKRTVEKKMVIEDANKAITIKDDEKEK